MGRNVFQQELKKVLSGKENSRLVWNGFLGDLNGNVSVSGKPNYVYATINDGQVVEVYNKIAPNIANLPVTIGFDPAQTDSNLLEILSIRNIPRFAASDSSYHVDGHHASHEWMNPDGNTDIVYVRLRQFMPLRPTIVPPYGIYIQPAMQRINNQWQVVGGNTLDLIDYKPAPHTVVSGSSAPALFVLLSLSATSGSVTITSGSTLTVGTLALTDIPTTPTGETPLCAVRLYAMQEKISESRLSTDIIDLRWGIPTSSASSGSGSGNHNDLAGLQGGQANEYYHLTAAEHAVAIQASGSGQNGYLSSADWIRFNATSGSGGISDAPIDGIYYARKDGSWSSFTPGSGSGGIPEAPIDGKQYARKDGEWEEVIASSSSGSGIYNKWDPDAPPLSPSIYDNEFSGSPLGGSWIEFDPNNLLTLEFTNYGIWLTQATRTGDNITGIVEPIPSGDFTISTKIQLSSRMENYTACGLALFENPLDSSKKITTLLETYNSTGMIIEGINWTNHNTFRNSIFSHAIHGAGTCIYLRIRRNGTNYYFDYSLDGMSWMNYNSTVTLSFTPTYFGIYINNVNTGDPVKALFKFFRYKNSDITDIGMLEGKSINVSDGSSSGISDAPADGKTYGRKNATWTEITSSSGSGAVGADGWVLDSNTWAVSGSDAPSYSVAVNADMTSIISPGMRIKVTQGGVTKFLLVTATGSFVSGSTVLTLYAGTDYTLSGSPISNPCYSTSKAPFGFPLDPAKWTVEITSGSLLSQVNPTALTYYNVGGLSITIPIGIWNVGYFASIQDGNATVGRCYCGLSTANNNSGDSLFLCYGAAAAPTGYKPAFQFSKFNILNIANKTTYYLNEMSQDGGGTLYVRGDNAKTIIRAVSAYL